MLRPSRVVHLARNGAPACNANGRRLVVSGLVGAVSCARCARTVPFRVSTDPLRLRSDPRRPFTILRTLYPDGVNPERDRLRAVEAFRSGALQPLTLR